MEATFDGTADEPGGSVMVPTFDRTADEPGHM